MSNQQPCLAILFSLLVGLTCQAKEAVVKEPAKAEQAKTATLRIKSNNAVELRKNIGKLVTVYGKVATTATSRSGNNFLNLEGRAVTVVVFPGDVKNFKKGKPADLFKGISVEVTGKVAEYKGKLQLKITKPADINIATATVASKTTIKPVELKKVEEGVFMSPAGLVYKGKDPMGLSRADHIRRHMKDIPDRAGPHGVFKGPEGVAWAVIDEAWQLAEKRKIKPNVQRNRATLTVAMGRPIGFLGGQVGAKRKNPELKKVFIVYEAKTNNIITAFPK